MRCGSKDFPVGSSIESHPFSLMPESTIGPSEHLSWRELACHDASKTPYHEAFRKDRALTLATAFEAIRAEFGGPIAILSAFRTHDWNKRVGGSRFSQHVEGRALDLGVNLKSLPRLIECVGRVALRDKVIMGIGVYPTFCHMDVRPSDKLIRWGNGITGRDRADVA